MARGGDANERSKELWFKLANKSLQRNHVIKCYVEGIFGFVYCAVCPPSTAKFTPVMYAARSEQSHTAA